MLSPLSPALSVITSALETLPNSVCQLLSTLRIPFTSYIVHWHKTGVFSNSIFQHDYSLNVSYVLSYPGLKDDSTKVTYTPDFLGLAPWDGNEACPLQGLEQLCIKHHLVILPVLG